MDYVRNDYGLNDYEINDDKSMISLDRVYELLSKTYWAGARSKDKIERSINNSICYGVYYKGEQVGFARVVTDFATMYWLCDVVIDEDHRGEGIGKRLAETIINSNQLKGLLGILCTKDAHGLYEKYGFKKEAEAFMRRAPY